MALLRLAHRFFLSPCGVPKTPRTKQIAAAAPWTAGSLLPLLGPQPAAARWTRKAENILE
ncbi:MAG TPA: hypothetical protein VG796_25245 [Verrucomicrobiales bacterium]|nr:hypothetical protein [Verrucomicrobiales bacterium]